MSLNLQNVSVGEMAKKPIFESITISQSRDGRMSATGQYRVELVTADGAGLASFGVVPFSMTHEELIANPDFADGYRIIRDLARSGLQSVAPEFVA